MTLSGPKKTVLQLVGVVVVMGGLAWASVPLYDWFCRVTGFGGTTQVAESGADEILDQTIKVRFDASMTRGMPWEVKPVVREVELRIGETAIAYYEAYNPTDRVVAGSSSYNVFPYSAGSYFSKIQCFCFEEQVLQPGERAMMPVTFFVDPEIVEGRESKYVHTITLSYTFYEIDLPEDYAGHDQKADMNIAAGEGH